MGAGADRERRWRHQHEELKLAPTRTRTIQPRHKRDPEQKPHAGKSTLGSLDGDADQTQTFTITENTDPLGERAELPRQGMKAAHP